MKLLFNYIFLFVVLGFLIIFLLPSSTKAQPTPKHRFFKIVDTEGNPIIDAKVELFARGELGSSPQTILQTNECGDIPGFLINGLISKYYSGNIKISKPGYISTILLISYSNIERTNDKSSLVLYEDLAIFETIEDCINCYNLLIGTENLWDIANPTTPKPIKIKLFSSPNTETEYEAFAQEQKNRELISAIVKDDTLNVRKMLRFGANPNAKTRHGIPAIVWATVHGNRPILEALLEAGADVKNKNSLAQKTLLYYIYFMHMTYSRSSEISANLVENLIKAGADVNASFNYGSNALSLTLSKLFNNKEVTKVLKQNGAIYSKEALKYLSAKRNCKKAKHLK